MYTYRNITLEVADRVATITLNRPEVGNAFHATSYPEIRGAFEACGADPEVGAVIITGAGKNFSAGGDIKGFKKNIENGTYINPDSVRRAGMMSQAARKCPKPVIAMVNGAAAGAGCSLALACDFRILTPKSKLILAFINMGLPGDTGAMYYAVRHLGVAKTIEMLMTGDPVDGEKADKLGLVTILAEEDKLAETTYAFAKKMAAKPLYAIKRQKEILYNYFAGGNTPFTLEDYTDTEAESMAECSRTADYAEAVNAFLEKRSPQFIGR
ncbi:MAG: enoyl-CoA hydratase/isomerase family protein [Lachnospiraceae bacterium]|jgi:2-(1,2-epoxy-1,2-dihydrophenyl)acetyl-CoA isomerase|nr:enoyl-CoA hydratase/isomerase family protein [Lachnospiraceae bacterium]